jgi:hypothetical protein
MSAKRRRDAIDKFSRPLEQSSRNTCNGRLIIRDGDSYDSDSMIDDDDNFIDEDDQQVFGRKSKRKGKGKAKDTRSGSADGDENPRVMLLSLKAVCCLQIIKRNLIIYKILGCTWFELDWYLFSSSLSTSFTQYPPFSC